MLTTDTLSEVFKLGADEEGGEESEDVFIGTYDAQTKRLTGPGGTVFDWSDAKLL